MKRTRTLKRRMLLATMLTAFPLLCILLAMNVWDREKMRREILKEYQAEVSEESAKADVLLRVLEESVASFPLNNSDIWTVADGRDMNKDFWLANQRLLNRINDMQKTSPADFKMFLYFPEKDIFYNYMENEELTVILKKKMQDEKQKNGKWEVVKADEEIYFVYVLDYSKYYIGSWISGKELCHFLGLEESNQMYYKFVEMEERADTNTNTGTVLCLTEPESKNQYLVSADSSCSAGSLVLYLDKEMVEQELPGMTDGFWLVFLTGSLIFAVYNGCIYRWMIVPMEKLRQSMEMIGKGDVKYRIPGGVEWSAEFVSVAEQFNAMMDQLEQLQHELYEGKLERQEVELQYLSRQIQPHFILNTLNTLYNYSESDIKTARDIIRLTSKYYRYVVNVNSRYVQLGQELEHIENYLRLQKIRYPSALDYEVACEEALDIIPVPPFLVESFISNAVKYGRTAGEMVHIRIQAEKLQKFQIRIRISDTGEGFSEDMLDILSEYLETGNASELKGTGIRNSIQRLRLIYGERAFIRFFNQESGGAVVEIQILVSQSV